MTCRIGIPVRESGEIVASLLNVLREAISALGPATLSDCGARGFHQQQAIRCLDRILIIFNPPRNSSFATSDFRVFIHGYFHQRQSSSPDLSFTTWRELKASDSRRLKWLHPQPRSLPTVHTESAALR